MIVIDAVVKRSSGAHLSFSLVPICSLSFSKFCATKIMQSDLDQLLPPGFHKLPLNPSTTSFSHFAVSMEIPQRKCLRKQKQTSKNARHTVIFSCVSRKEDLPFSTFRHRALRQGAASPAASLWPTSTLDLGWHSETACLELESLQVKKVRCVYFA